MSRWHKTVGLALAAILVAGGVMFGRPAVSEAHCDSVSGPVVKAAEQALEMGSVEVILPYIKAADEAELKAAFEHTLAVRKLGGEAKSLSDHFFFETAVRLHRKGEGAPYTGLKYDADFGPALEAAEAAVESSDLSKVERIMTEALREALHERFEAIKHARVELARTGSVEADRERVEAELGFEVYVHEVYNAITAGAPHGEGAEAGEGGGTAGHQH